MAQAKNKKNKKTPKQTNIINIIFEIVDTILWIHWFFSQTLITESVCIIDMLFYRRSWV